MKLQEQINRIQEMMGLISENRVKDLIFDNYDKVFDKLQLIKTEDDLYQFDWVDENGKKIFERNDWGRLWVYGCDEYSKLTFVPRMASLEFYEFEESLMYYLNKRYDNEFGKNPLIDISSEDCYDEFYS